jgi:hypothetical protein
MTTRPNVPLRTDGVRLPTNPRMTGRPIPPAIVNSVPISTRSMSHSQIPTPSVTSGTRTGLPFSTSGNSKPTSPRDKTPIVIHGNIINRDVSIAPPQHVLVFPATPAVGSFPIPPLNPLVSTVEPMKRPQSPISRSPPRIETSAIESNMNTSQILAVQSTSSSDVKVVTPQSSVSGENNHLVSRVSPQIVPPVSRVSPQIVQPVSRVSPQIVQPVSRVSPQIVQPVSRVSPQIVQPVSRVSPQIVQPVSRMSPQQPILRMSPQIVQPVSTVSPQPRNLNIPSPNLRILNTNISLTQTPSSRVLTQRRMSPQPPIVLIQSQPAPEAVAQQSPLLPQIQVNENGGINTLMNVSIPVSIPSPRLNTNIGTVDTFSGTPPARAASPIYLHNPNTTTPRVVDVTAEEFNLQTSPSTTNNEERARINQLTNTIIENVLLQPPSEDPSTNPQPMPTLSVNSQAVAIPALSRIPVRPNYVEMEPLMQEEMKIQFRVKFGMLRTNYPQYNILDPPEGSSLDTCHTWYESYVRQIVIAANSTKWMMCLYLVVLGIEVVGIKVLGLNFSGFFINQLRIMGQYQTLMTELGEKYYVQGGNGWSVEAKLLFLVLGNAVVFLIVGYLGSHLGEGPTSLIRSAFDQIMAGGNVNADSLGISAPRSTNESAPSIQSSTSATSATPSGPGFNLNNIMGSISSAFGGAATGGTGGSDVINNIFSAITGAINNNGSTSQSSTSRRTLPRFTE